MYTKQENISKTALELAIKCRCRHFQIGRWKSDLTFNGRGLSVESQIWLSTLAPRPLKVRSDFQRSILRRWKSDLTFNARPGSVESQIWLSTLNLGALKVRSDFQRSIYVQSNFNNIANYIMCVWLWQPIISFVSTSFRWDMVWISRSSMISLYSQVT